MKFTHSLAFWIAAVMILSACTPAPAALPTSTAVQPGTPTPEPPPAWLSMKLTDASTGKEFTINDFKGKVVLVEMMATWCPNCLRQGQQLKALHDIYGPNDLVTVSLGIDLKEDAAMLKEYARVNEFNWPFAVVTLDLTRDTGNRYGALFMDPTLNPILVVDRKGEVFKMGFGEKKADAMKDSLAPLIKAGS
jgi:thiol-disulfide isomerase/thioredoxin